MVFSLQYNYEVLGFVDCIKDALAKMVIPSKYLLIEITISSIFNNAEKIHATLNQLHELGISIALNNFAQGLASFQQLRELPVSRIKLEQTFVSDAVQGKQNC